MNQIGTIHFDFRMQNESFARGLYGRWDKFFATCVESVADEALKKLKIENGEWRINHIELDLGSILEEQLDAQFPIRFREKLEEALIKWIIEKEQSIKNDKEQGSKLFSILNFQFSILKTLCRFLLYGSLDWSTQQYKSISELFLLVLKAHGAELKQFLHQYGHYTSLQQRLVYQLNQPELEAGVQLLVPSESTFIISYVRLLHQKHKQIEKPVLTETDHRVAVWKVMYAYLLTNRSSYFNKKSFVVQTITQLAAEYNTNYQALLAILTHELAQFAKDKALLPELFDLLDELQKELDQRQFESSAQSASKLYKSLSVYLQDQLKIGLTEQHREALIRMLSQPESCRKFLDLLREEEIIRLVPIVIPNESNFVIAYAHSLDQQKEQGVLQGKAGGEFSKLKWQFIFTLLFANRGTMFNRKQFVSGVLKQIAQHYNMEVMLLLEYFQTMMFTFTNDKQLQIILTELYQEIQKQQTKTSISLFSETIGSLKEEINKGVSDTRRKEILQIVSQADTRKLFIEQVSEGEIIRLLPVLIPKESHFVIEYAGLLDKQKERGALEGKAGGEFSKLKWQLIFALLFEQKQATFNRKYFIYHVLKDIAAHYNLEVIDLLQYLHQEVNKLTVGSQLRLLLQELYEQQNKVDIKTQNNSPENISVRIKKAAISDAEKKEIWHILSNNKQRDTMLHQLDEKEHQQLIRILFGSESRFILSYVAAIIHLCKQILPVETDTFIKQSWCFLWMTLTDVLPTAFDRKRLIGQTLKSIAAYYRLTYLDLLISICKNSNQYRVATDVKSLLQRLLVEEKKQWVALVLQLQRKENIIMLLNTFYPKESVFVRSYSIWLENCFRPMVLPSVSKRVFFVWIWNLLLSLLEEQSLRGNFSRKELMKQMFERIAKQYRLTYQTLYHTGLFDKPTSNTSHELHRLLHQLYCEQTNRENDSKHKHIEEDTKSDQSEELQRNKSLILEEEMNDSIYIDNAGIVLIAPYLPRLFSMLELMKDGIFIDREAQIRAMFIMQYLVFERTEFPEYEMMLNKLLTNFNTGDPIPQQVELTEKEKETVDSLLHAVLQHWEKLKNTSIQGLREGFLQREGKLYHTDKGWQLTVETKSYDMLLDTLPWSFNSVKFSWMKQIIRVNWR